jgi:endonuclease III
MKNAGKHADELKALAKKLLKDRSGKREPMDPIRALVVGGLMADAPDSRVNDAMKVIEREFTDFNELRVATELEIQDLVGSRYPNIEQRVSNITQALNAIFEREHTLSLSRLREISKRDARQFLRELPGVSPYVEAYVMLMAFEGAAFPVDETMLAALKHKGIVEPESTAEETQKFIEHNIKADDLHDLVLAMRQWAQDEAEKSKSKKK